MKTIQSKWLPVAIGILVLLAIAFKLTYSIKFRSVNDKIPAEHLVNDQKDSEWIAPILNDDEQVKDEETKMVIYGRDIIAHTSKYFGPRGIIAHNANGMNCQNCHLNAGTRPWGNNYAGVYSCYPQLRARNNNVQTIYGRINDCFKRSLNGKALDSNSYEMRSIYAYMKWLGKDVPKSQKPFGTGLPKLNFIARAADPINGKLVYLNKCRVCHAGNGEGFLNTAGIEYIYPPLWGEHSYNDGAGLYRLTRFASFVENNMPFNQANHKHPILTDEEAWDVAAFVNSQNRPHFDQSKDWPDIRKKSFDEPFGPYQDKFSENQHKYGPFKPISDRK